MYRLSYERLGDISFIARETIWYFVTSERSERQNMLRNESDKTDISESRMW